MRSMNGSSGNPDRTYPPGGLPLPPGLVPSLGGSTGPTPGLPPSSASLSGLGFSGASGGGVSLGSGAGASAPELKHHADFLSRLLAATPSYMSEVGNPPPGFFSDWLRRLVSKPSGSSSSSLPAGAQLTFPTSGQGGSASSGGSAPTLNNSGGQAETEGRGHRPSESGDHTPAKRRKRARLNEQLGEKEERQSPGRPPSTTMTGATSPHLPGQGGQNQAQQQAAAAAAAAAAFHPFGPHPFWFFPPFLPNPYMNSATAAAAAAMGMGVPFNQGQGSSPSQTGTFLNSSPSTELFRTDNLNLLSGSITTSQPSNGRVSGSSPGQINPFVTPNLLDSLPQHLRKSEKEKDVLANSPPLKDSYYSAAAAAAAAASTSLLLNSSSSPTKVSQTSPHYLNGGHKMPNKSPPVTKTKSSSFSISRLTSPSPSGGRHYHHSTSATQPNPNPTFGKESATSSNAIADVKKENFINNPSSKPKGYASTGSSSSDSGLCVDLRVSGRIWESGSSGSSASSTATGTRGGTPPRPIYTPLSAFRDPQDVNLFGNHQQGQQAVSRFDTHLPLESARYGISPLSLLHGKAAAGAPPPSYHLPPAPPQQSAGKTSPKSGLSTRYVLGNLQKIYQKIKPSKASSSTPVKSSPERIKRRRSSSASSTGKESPVPPKPIIRRETAGQENDAGTESTTPTINLHLGKIKRSKSHKLVKRKMNERSNGNVSGDDDESSLKKTFKAHFSSESEHSSISSEDERNVIIDEADNSGDSLDKHFLKEEKEDLKGINGQVNFNLSLLNNNNVEGKEDEEEKDSGSPDKRKNSFSSSDGDLIDLEKCNPLEKGKKEKTDKMDEPSEQGQLKVTISGGKIVESVKSEEESRESFKDDDFVNVLSEPETFDEKN